MADVSRRNRRATFAPAGTALAGWYDRDNLTVVAAHVGSDETQAHSFARPVPEVRAAGHYRGDNLKIAPIIAQQCTMSPVLCSRRHLQ